jgi:hypothetical protein
LTVGRLVNELCSKNYSVKKPPTANRQPSSNKCRVIKYGK